MHSIACIYRVTNRLYDDPAIRLIGRLEEYNQKNSKRETRPINRPVSNRTFQSPIPPIWNKDSQSNYSCQRRGRAAQAAYYGVDFLFNSFFLFLLLFHSSYIQFNLFRRELIPRPIAGQTGVFSTGIQPDRVFFFLLLHFSFSILPSKFFPSL